MRALLPLATIDRTNEPHRRERSHRLNQVPTDHLTHDDTTECGCDRGTGLPNEMLRRDDQPLGMCQGCTESEIGLERAMSIHTPGQTWTVM